MQIIEQYIKGKITDKCEDAIVVTEDFVAVIDGSTSKSKLPALPNGKTGGRMAADIVSEVIQAMPAETTVEQFVELVNARIQEEYARAYDKETISGMLEHKENRWTCSAIIYSRHEQQIWMVGDCQGLLIADDGTVTELNNDKPYEAVLAKVRAEYLHEQLGEGNITIEETRRHDTGRDLIIPEMLQEMKNQNVTYAVLDGFPIAWDGVKVISCCNIPEIVLASDGYPKLFPTLQQSGEYLRFCLKEDPLMITHHIATKAWMEGTDSFDDRTYIRFRQ